MLSMHNWGIFCIYTFLISHDNGYEVGGHIVKYILQNESQILQVLTPAFPHQHDDDDYNDNHQHNLSSYLPSTHNGKSKQLWDKNMRCVSSYFFQQTADNGDRAA